MGSVAEYRWTGRGRAVRHVADRAEPSPAVPTSGRKTALSLASRSRVRTVIYGLHCSSIG